MRKEEEARYHRWEKEFVRLDLEEETKINDEF